MMAKETFLAVLLAMVTKLWHYDRRQEASPVQYNRRKGKGRLTPKVAVKIEKRAIDRLAEVMKK